MFDYQAELRRRIEQFRGFLAVMNRRAHEIARGPYFMIFEEKGADAPQAAELAPPGEPMGQLLQTFTELGLLTKEDVAVRSDLPEEGWREDLSANRFVQFSFEKDCFHLDMPLDTLTREEAEQILSRRRGFFYLRERPQFTLHGEDVEGHEPFRKVYVYGDEGSAAEDMAFIFFQVWKFPPDSVLYVTAAAFSGKHDWEDHQPIT
jgi:hypothetical protein